MEGRSSLLFFLVITFLNGCESTYHVSHVDTSKITPRSLTVSSFATHKGYTLFPDDNVAYKIYNDKITWEEARNRCISDGGDLAIADTVEKIERFSKLDFDSNDWLFIGIHKPPGSKQWIRIDNGLPVTSLTKTYDFLLNTSSDCVVITTSSKKLLADVPCSWQHQSICEIRLPSTNSIDMKDETTTRALQSSVLPEGYSIYPGDNIAYKMYKDEMTWLEARYRCLLDGGDLAIADSPEKIERIEMLGSDIEDLMFVGILKPNGSEEWLRIDNGLPVTSLPWIRIRFNLPSFDCAAITHGFQLSEVPCEQKHQSVCEINLASYGADGTKVESMQTTTTQALSSFELPEGYSVYPNDNVAYKIYKDKMTWEEARYRCSLDGGDLAVADTQQKIRYMSNMDSNNNYFYFVGFYRPTGSDKWIRVDNGSSVTSLPWFKTPKVDSGSDCAIIAADESPVLMNFPCNMRLKWFCEIRIDEYHSSKTDNSLAVNGQECTRENNLYLFIVLYLSAFLFAG